jgi:hypothetical protein
MASNLTQRQPLASPTGINQTFTNFVENNFNIDTFQYPSDLGKDDLKHFVEFTINVRGKSLAKDTLSGGGRLGTERTLGQVTRAADSASLTAEELASATTNLALVTGGVAGLGAGKIASSFFEKLFNKQSKTGGTNRASGGLSKTLTNVAAPAAGALTAAALVNFNDTLKPDTSFKISDAIALYIDGPPTVRYAAQYSNKDLGTLAGLAAGGISAVASGEGVAGAAALFAQSAQAIAGVNIADVVGSAAKVALNPFKEVLFEAIDFRTFNFKYRFFPKSVEEANSVEKIIKLFKFHMHPDLSANKLFFIYPSEFEIAYYFENKENLYFHRLKPCVLESMDIAYGGEQFSTFRDGKPTEINMTLTFRETEILTKKQIRDGY